MARTAHSVVALRASRDCERGSGSSLSRSLAHTAAAPAGAMRPLLLLALLATAVAATPPPVLIQVGGGGAGRGSNARAHAAPRPDLDPDRPPPPHPDPFQGATVVNADSVTVADVLLKGGKIARVSPTPLRPPRGAAVVRAAGLLLAPGGVDPHTHLDAPFMGGTADDYWSGTRAALAGGTTTVIDFALPAHPSQPLAAAHARAAALVTRDAAADVGLHVAVAAPWSDEVKRDMASLSSRGVASFKFFLAYKGAYAIDDGSLLEAMAHAKGLGAVSMAHCENADAVDFLAAATVARGVTGPEGHALSRPASLEDEGTARAIALAGIVGAPLYVVHVMSRGAAASIAAARATGQPVYGEAVTAGVAGDSQGVRSKNFTVAAAHVMSPPIRSVAHQTALGAALARGDLQGIATDHAPFSAAAKATAAARADFRAIPNGVNGVQERMVIAYDLLVVRHKSNASRWVEATSTAAAKAFGLFPAKGSVTPGADADLVLLDPGATTTFSAATHASAADVSVWEGRTFAGRVAGVWRAGARVVAADGSLIDATTRRGSGRLLKLCAGASSLFEGVAAWDAARWGPAEFPGGLGAVARPPTRDEL